MFAGTIPKKIEQDERSGRNNLYAAKAARFIYNIDHQNLSDGFDIKWIVDFEETIQIEVGKWTENSKYINAQVFTWDTWERALAADTLADIGFLLTAIVLVSVYSYTVLGAFNPILFRSLTAAIGMTCVLISIVSGYAFAFLIG